jgi:O-antigen ligase
MYLALFTLVSSMRISVSAFKRCYWTLVSILLVSASFGWAQYWNLLDINTRIVPHYTTSQLVNLGGWSRRIVGTTGNPNSFAALMILAASLALAGALWLKGRGARLVLWAGFGVFVFTLVLTSSRSGLMGLVLACGVILFVKYPAHFRARGVARALFVFVPVLALTLVTIAPLLPAGFRFRMADALRPQASAGLQERFVRWQTHLDLWRESPVVGLGPAKGVISTNVDNEFLLVLARYGVVGLAVFLFLCVGLYACVTRLRRNTLTTEATALVVALEAVFLAYVVFMLLAGVYHDMQLMSIVLIVLGLARTQQTSMQRRSK